MSGTISWIWPALLRLEADDGPKYFLTVENIGPETIIHFVTEVSADSQEWFKIASLCLTNQRIPQIEYQQLMRLHVPPDGIYIAPSQLLYCGFDEFPVEIPGPDRLRLRYHYSHLTGKVFESGVINQFVTVTREG